MNSRIDEVPQLFEELLDKSLGNITTGSMKKLTWRCSKYESHVWEASPANRVRTFLCPYCSGRKILRGFNDLSTTDPILVTELFNISDGFEVSRGSDRKLEWVCKNGHNYFSSVSNRILGKGCSYCKGNRYVLSGFNDLKTMFPSIAEEYVGDPSTIHSRSNKSASWKCHKGHEWEALVSNRTRYSNSSCPKCSLAGSSTIEVNISDKLLSLGLNVINGYKIPGVRGCVDIYLEPSIAIEFDGKYWHKDTLRDLNKTNMLLERGLTVIRIRDYGLHSLDIFEEKYKEILLNNSPYTNKGFNLLIQSLLEIL